MQRIFDACLFLLHLHLSRCAHFDQGDAAGELGDPLLQLFLVVIGGRLLDLLANALDARFDVLLLTRAIDDGGIFFFDQHLLGLAQIIECRFFQRQADFIRDHRAAGQNRDVLQHCLATIAEARRLDGGNLDDAAHRVDHQRGEGLAFNVLRDDQELPAAFGNRLE